MQSVRDKIIQFVKSWSPLSDRVIIIPDSKDIKTSKGIYYADTKLGETKRQSGEILVVGKGRISDHGALIPVEVTEGDRVIFKKYAGDEMLVNEDGTIEAFVGEPPREDQILVNFIRQDSILSILPNAEPA